MFCAYLYSELLDSDRELTLVLLGWVRTAARMTHAGAACRIQRCSSKLRHKYLSTYPGILTIVIGAPSSLQT